MMRSCKQQAIFWVSSCLCQCNFNIYCFKHIAFQYFSNCPEENSLKASFKCMSVNLLCVIIGTKHCQILHLSQYLSFERKKNQNKKLCLCFLDWVWEHFYLPFAKKSSIFPVESLSDHVPRIWGIPSVYVSDELARQKMREKIRGGKQSLENVWEMLRKDTHTYTYFSNFLETMEIPPLLEKPPFLSLLSKRHPKTSVLTAVIFVEWNKMCFRGSMGAWEPWTYVQCSVVGKYRPF